MQSLRTRLGKRLLARPKIGALVMTAALVVAFHKPLLQSVAGALVVREQAIGATHIVILGTHSIPDRSFTEAARAYEHDEVREIVLVNCRPSRLVRIGVMPSFVELSRRELARNGVPASAVVEIDGEVCDAWQSARRLRRWMADRPDAQPLVLCDEFASRYHRHIFDCVLDKPVAARVHIRALNASAFDGMEWWRTRSGAKQIAFAYLSLGFAWFNGESPDPMSDDWDADELERALRERWRSAG